MLDTVFKTLLNYGVRTIAGLSGGWAWLVELIVTKIYKNFLRPAFIKAWSQVLVNKEVNDELKKYKEVINDPKSTADDVKKAAPDFLG